MRRTTKKFKAVTAKGHTPPYKIHRYFARRPWNLFEGLIEHYSRPGDLILDPFCGGGVTVYEGVKMGRRVVASDINPLSTFIVRNMFHNSTSEELTDAYNQISDYLDRIVTPSYEITCPECRKRTTAGWYELAHVTSCNLCQSEIVMTENNKVRNGIYRCPNSRCWGSKTGVPVARSKRQTPSYLNVNGQCQHCQQRYSVEVDTALLDINRLHVAELKRMVKKAQAELPDAKIPLEWDRQKEDLLSEKGIEKFQDLFTRKNLYINYLLLKKIKEYEHNSKVYLLLRFVFSDSLRDTNIMTFTNGTWQNGTPTTWAKHAYWLPAVFCEVNVHDAFAKSFTSILKSVEFNKAQGIKAKEAKRLQNINRGSNIYLKTGTLADLRLLDKSVDAVITDPPYGSNVQYLELSHFWYPWNQDVYDNADIDHVKEAVVTRKSNFKNAKSYKSYEDNLYAIFAESHRVLKKGGYIVMTFNNKDLKAWLALLISIFRSNFHFEKGGITFQDGVANYRQTAHTKAKGSPYGDFVYEFIKDAPAQIAQISQLDREELVAHIKERIDNAVANYNRGTKDRNEIIVDLFNEIIPEIESFVRISKKKGVIDDLYDVFSKSHLEPLYAAA